MRPLDKESLEKLRSLFQNFSAISPLSVMDNLDNETRESIERTLDNMANFTLTSDEVLASIDASAVLHAFYIIIFVGVVVWICLASLYFCQRIHKTKKRIGPRCSAILKRRRSRSNQPYECPSQVD